VLSVEAKLKVLMIAGLAGNATAYERLLEAAGGHLRSYYARRLGADSADLEDLVQETLIAIHQKRESYDRKLPFTAWLHAIARYKLIDHLRSRGVRKQIALEDIGEIAAANEFDACLAAADVENLLAGLPAKQRQAIRLTHIEGRSVAEAAATTGQSLSGIKTNVHRGLRRLIARVNGGHGEN
jgi:RNA polymerase sigma-70 factor (ECF subfamily)